MKLLSAVAFVAAFTVPNSLREQPRVAAESLASLVSSGAPSPNRLAWRRMRAGGTEAKVAIVTEQYVVQVLDQGYRMLVLFSTESSSYQTFTDVNIDGKVDNAGSLLCEGNRCERISFTRAGIFPQGVNPHLESRAQKLYEDALARVRSAYP